VLSSVIRIDAEEKYSYVVIQKTVLKDTASSNTWIDTPSSRPTTADPTPLEVLNRVIPCPRTDMEELVEQLLDEVDWQTYSPPLYRSEWSRIIRLVGAFITFTDV
jgi:hypothetical protein